MLDNNILWLLIGCGLTVLMIRCGIKAKLWYQHWQYGDIAFHQDLLGNFSHQMVSRIEDRQAITRLFTQEIPKSIEVRESTILFTNGKTVCDEFERQLPIHNAAIRRVIAGGKAVRSTGQLQKLIEQGRIDLSWTYVWVPLLRGTNFYGVWLLGKRSSRQGFSAVHLDWLTTFAKQAAMILEMIDYAQNEQLIAREMQTLYHQAVRARESERNHLSRELHDGVLQDLCTISRDLKALTKSTTEIIAPTTLTACVNESIQALRNICYDLRPPFLESNLISALKILSERIENYSASPISVETSIEKLLLPDDITLAIYRIVQEALNNAADYADASEITVRLIYYPNKLRVTVSDDGKGIEHNDDLGHYVAQGNLGLAGMRERANMIGANLEFHSAPDYGTTIILDIPVGQSKA